MPQRFQNQTPANKVNPFNFQITNLDSFQKTYYQPNNFQLNKVYPS